MSPPPVPELRWPDADPGHGRVRLRAFAPTDAPMVLDLATDPYFPDLGSLPAPAGPADALAYIERQHGRLADGIGFSFCVADASTGDALGTIGLWTGARRHGRASIGYAVAPRARGCGVAGEALIAVTAFAWTVPDLHRLELYIEPWNTASLRTAERAGYQREGLLRSHRWIAGRRADMVLYSAIRMDADQAASCSRSSR